MRLGNLKNLIFVALLATFVNAKEDRIQIFKSITSTCPQSWLDDIKKEVENVEIVTLHNLKMLKADIGINVEIQSCNTSILKDYVFEGNVPVKAIKEFLANVPKNAVGLSLPSYENDKEEKTVYIIFEDKSFKEYGKYK